MIRSQLRELGDPALPGQLELETMCESARAVASLCDALRVRAELRGGELHHHHHPRDQDGAWILPEEL